MKIIGISAAFMTLMIATASAAGLAEKDYTYLRDHWGLKRDSAVVRNLTAEEAAKLHALINDPANRNYPHTIENQVGDYLFQIEICFDRSDATPCPNAPGPNDLPGKRVAYRYCIACHLVGTGSAPSFYRMATSHWTAERLGTALKSGHEMSPMTLSDSELHDLAAYIDSFR